MFEDEAEAEAEAEAEVEAVAEAEAAAPRALGIFKETVGSAGLKAPAAAPELLRGSSELLVVILAVLAPPEPEPEPEPEP